MGFSIHSETALTAPLTTDKLRETRMWFAMNAFEPGLALCDAALASRAKYAAHIAFEDATYDALCAKFADDAEVA